MRAQEVEIIDKEPVAVYQDHVYTWSVRVAFFDRETMWLFNHSQKFTDWDVGSSAEAYILTDCFDVLETRCSSEGIFDSEYEWGYSVRGTVCCQSESDLSPVDNTPDKYISIKSRNKYINAIGVDEDVVENTDAEARINIESFRTDVVLKQL